MKFLLRTGCGESLSVGLRLMQEGNQVRFCMSDEADKSYREIGKGLIDYADFKTSVQWSDVVVFDSNIFALPEEAERARRVRPTIGSSALSGKLENDRAFAVQFAKQTGLNVPTYKEFTGNGAWRDAKEFLEGCESDSCWVWKPNGEAPASTYVAESTEELRRLFVYWERLYKEHKEVPNFILTEKIDGEEISTEGWFNGSDFYAPNHTLERTRFFNGDHGEKTGCAGNVVWGHDGPLFKSLVQPFQSSLRGKYIGPFDINAIIEKESNEPVFLEFTPRFGYDAIFSFMECLQSDLGEFFSQLANGETVTPTIKSDFAGAIRLHIPPYPEAAAKNDDKRPYGIPVFGFGVEDKVGPIYPVEVMVEEDELATSGPDGYVLVACGHGATPKDAMETAYKRADRLVIPLVRYRTDLAEKLGEVYGKIKDTGWLGERASNVFRKRA
jgi:phosphoribosylamine-glycine ligase